MPIPSMKHSELCGGRKLIGMDTNRVSEGVYSETRWCVGCGAIVIDKLDDTARKNYPGYYSPMRFPFSALSMAGKPLEDDREIKSMSLFG